MLLKFKTLAAKLRPDGPCKPRPDIRRRLPKSLLPSGVPDLQFDRLPTNIDHSGAKLYSYGVIGVLLDCTMRDGREGRHRNSDFNTRSCSCVFMSPTQLSFSGVSSWKTLNLSGDKREVSLFNTKGGHYYNKDNPFNSVHSLNSDLIC